MNDDLKLLIYVLFILVCAGIVGTFDREAEELTQTHSSMDGRELRESD